MWTAWEQEEGKNEQQTPAADDQGYRNTWNRWEELALYIGRSLIPQKSFDDQLRIGKNVIEGLSKNNPIGKNAIDWVVQRGYLKPERRDEFVKRCVEIYNALKRGNQMK